MLLFTAKILTHSLNRREAHLRYGEYDIDQTHAVANPLDSQIGRMFSVVHPGPTGIYQVEARKLRYYWEAGLTDGTDPSVEPLAGKADGILYLTIEDAYKTKTAAENVAIWAPQIVSESEQTIVDLVDGEDSSKYAANTFDWGRDREQISQEDRDAYWAESGQASQQREPYDVRATAATQPMAISSSICTELYCSGASCERLHAKPFISGPPAALASHSDSSNRNAPWTSSNSHNSSSKKKGARIKTRNLYIPLLACEFKHLLRRWTTNATTDQERLYLIAICTFIRLFNARFPIFGLVTSGPCGVISCAWNELIHVEIPESEHNAAKDEHTAVRYFFRMSVLLANGVTRQSSSRISKRYRSTCADHWMHSTWRPLLRISWSCTPLECVSSSKISTESTRAWTSISSTRTWRTRRWQLRAA